MISGDAIAMNDSHDCEHHHEAADAGPEAEGNCDAHQFLGGTGITLLEEYEQNKKVTTILSNIITTPNSNDSRQFFE